tara:strand:+ start:544 stop:1701 length:1158 start_codon:yes stop_codon:yes gene_type:complete
MTAVEFEDAYRENVPIILGVSGGTGSGKTCTAMRLATGLSGGKPFVVIDTERGRAKLFAPKKGEEPKSPESFRFKTKEIEAPFTPSQYGEFIEAADNAGYPVIVVDSMSHEHAGEGGLLDMHDAEIKAAIARARKYNDTRPEWEIEKAHNMAAWIKPKGEHKKMMQKLLRVRAHLILCFRAEAKVEMVKEGRKWVVAPKQSVVGLEGWIPVGEKNIPYELTASWLLTANQPGVPKAINKMPAAFARFVPMDKPITEEAGRLIGEWARGGVTPREETPKTTPKAETATAPEPTPPPGAPDREDLNRRADEAAKKGYAALENVWAGLTNAERKVLKPDIEAYKRIAADVDVGNAAAETEPEPEPEPKAPVDASTSGPAPDEQEDLGL